MMYTDAAAGPGEVREGQGRRALITGLHGFTGRYVARELRAAGYSVFGTVMPGDETGPGLFAADLCDREAVAEAVAKAEPDVVVHLAGISFVAHANVDQIYHVNVAGTRNLLEALAGLAYKPSAVLLASSANVYGNADVASIGEDVVPVPANDYAVSKLAMEYMARLWMDKLPIVIARPFNYTGIGQSEKFLLPKIVSHFRRGARCIELGNLAIARDFSDVRVIAKSYRRLLTAAPAGEAFNICSGHSYSLQSVLNLMSDIAGYHIEVQVNPAFVRANENEVLTLAGCNDKLAKTIGPIEPPPLVETLRWMYQA